MDNDNVLSQIKKVLTLSQFETIGAIFLLAGLSFYVGMSVFNANEYVKQAYETIQGTLPAYAANYEQVAQQINSNDYVANATVFIVWAITGLLAFYIVLILWGSEKSIAELIRMLRRGGESMRLALEERLVRYAIRITAIIALLLVINLFVTTVLPLLVVWALVLPGKEIAEYVLSVIWLWASLVVTTHVVIVLLRCIMLRQRLMRSS